MVNKPIAVFVMGLVVGLMSSYSLFSTGWDARVDRHKVCLPLGLLLGLVALKLHKVMRV